MHGVDSGSSVSSSSGVGVGSEVGSAVGAATLTVGVGRVASSSLVGRFWR